MERNLDGMTYVIRSRWVQNDCKLYLSATLFQVHLQVLYMMINALAWTTVLYTNTQYVTLCTKSFASTTWDTLIRFQLCVHRVMLLIFTIWLFAKAAWCSSMQSRGIKWVLSNSCHDCLSREKIIGSSHYFKNSLRKKYLFSTKKTFQIHLQVSQ